MAETVCDYLIIGAGIIGLSLARKLKERFPSSSIILIEKESDAAQHSSGRNSGVLHAGFYYTADSLKARFCVAGNQALKAYCRENHLPINQCGKLVVALNAGELDKLHDLEQRGKSNGSTVSLVTEQEAREIEPNARTFKQALHSPDTATLDPKALCQTIKQEISQRGVTCRFNCRYLCYRDGVVHTSQERYRPRRMINCAGLYADCVAQDLGFGLDYTIIPFKGLYLKYVKNTTDIRTNIYPVPNLRNPFLGVHFTKTVDGGIKIGPTAIPSFWRENYDFTSRFNAKESASILYHEAILFLTNAFDFRGLAFEEMKKYYRPYLIGLAMKLARNVDPNGFGGHTAPGIRAQLLNCKTRELVQDFVIEADQKSVHVLNAVSPALTCSFPFADYLIDHYLKD